MMPLLRKMERRRIGRVLRKAAKKLEQGKENRAVELMRAAYGDIFFSGRVRGKKN